MTLHDFRFKLLCRLGALLCPTYPFKWPQMDWLDHQWFNAYLARFGEEGGHNAERRWMMRELLRLIEGVPGDTAECGAFEGAGSYLICEMTAACKSQQRWHNIFDSFEGVSAPSDLDGSFWRKGDMARGEELVRRNLAWFDAYSLYKGWIPERFPDVADKRFAFVHIDVDLYQPTLDSMRFFYGRMSEGGIILCDDFGFATCPGATQAVDEALSDKPERMIALPSGGGFLIKGTWTSRHGGLAPQ